MWWRIGRYSFLLCVGGDIVVAVLTLHLAHHHNLAPCIVSQAQHSDRKKANENPSLPRRKRTDSRHSSARTSMSEPIVSTLLSCASPRRAGQPISPAASCTTVSFLMDSFKNSGITLRRTRLPKVLSNNPSAIRYYCS